MGAIRSDRIAEAFRAVPRHLFALGAPLEEVYTATATVEWDEHGVPISTVSAPELQAFMLEQAATANWCRTLPTPGISDSA
jgi:protein-L-isoaspartate(D-aspartate) O-methyltransferase